MKEKQTNVQLGFNILLFLRELVKIQKIKNIELNTISQLDLTDIYRTHLFKCT